MAATTAGAIKTFIESLGLSVPCFRDRAPQNKSDGTKQTYPYVVIHDSLDDVPIKTGDNGYKRTIELVQVDVYEYIVDPVTGVRGESYSLAKTIFKSLLTTRLGSSPDKVWQLRDFGKIRTFDEDLNEIKNIISLTIIRNL